MQESNLASRLAHLFLALRECMLPSRPREQNEEVVARLHGYIENLEAEAAKMMAEADNAHSQATHFARLGQKETVPRMRAEHLHKARMYLSQRNRMQARHAKATNTIQLLQQQIDSVVSSHVDTLVIDAMKQYSMAASRLGLPDRAAEVHALHDDMQDHQSEMKELQDALQAGLSTICEVQDEEELSTELDHLLLSEEPPASSGLVQRRPPAAPVVLPETAEAPLVRELLATLG